MRAGRARTWNRSGNHLDEPGRVRVNFGMVPPKIFGFIRAGIVLCVLSSCASVEQEAVPSRPDRPKSGKALVIFYRERHFAGSAMGYDILDNGVKIGGLSNGSYFVYQASPGSHRLSAVGAATDEKVTRVEAGKTYYIRGEVQVGLFVEIGRPHLTLVTQEEGANAIKDLRRVKLQR